MAQAAAPTTSVGVHSATSGYEHKANALYDASRPAYADDVVDYLLQAAVGDAITAPVDTSAPVQPRVIRLVDLGAGTGIFTRCLSARLKLFEQTHAAALQARGLSFEVVAVEPVAGMRLRFQEHCPGLTVVEGSGSSMPALASGSVDAVFAAQSFHWFATVEALAEIARVLRPRSGKFLPVWNSRDTSVDWIGELDRTIVDPLYPEGVPRQQTRRWKQAFALCSPPQFELRAKKEWRQGMVQTGGADMVIGRVLSISVVASLPQPEQDRIAERIRELLRTHAQTRGLQQFELKYFTEAYVFWKLDEDEKTAASAATVAASSSSAAAVAPALDGAQSFTTAIHAGWLNEPSEWSVCASGTALSLTTSMGSDFWQRTHYGFRRDSGHFLAFHAPSTAAAVVGEAAAAGAGTAAPASASADGFTASVRIRSSDFSTLYDQAGIMVRVDEARWIKAGVELSDGQCMASTVVTNAGFSDWSTAPFAGTTSVAQAAAAASSSAAASSAAATASAAAAPAVVDFRVRVTVSGGSVRVQLSHDDGRTWPLIRLAPFPVAAGESCSVGPMSCSPQRAGLRVEFSEMTITKANGKDLHDLS